MYPSQPSGLALMTSQEAAENPDLTAIIITGNTCVNICEKDGKLWRDRGSDYRPTVSRTSWGKIWVEWVDARTAYELDDEEARWLVKELSSLVGIPAKKMGRPSKGKPWLEAGVSKASWYRQQKSKGEVL